MKNFITLLLIIMTYGTIHAQYEEWQPTLASQPVHSGKINLVILSDGYTLAQKDDFFTQATLVENLLFEASAANPFYAYRNYFNVYQVFVESNQSGADHPCTGECDTGPCSAVYKDTRFNSSYDTQGFDGTQNVNFHRLICADASEVHSYIEGEDAAFTSAFYTTIVIVGSSIFGGCGDMDNEIATVVGGYYASPSYAAETAIHEFAHSFIKLQDEYFYDNGITAANKTNVNNPGSSSHEWYDWLPLPSIAHTQHTPYTNVANCDYSISGTTNWWKPNVGGNCKMENVTSDFCLVCKEAIVEHIHDVVNPILDVSPSTNTPVTGTSQTFELTNVILPDPNSLHVTWEIKKCTTAVADCDCAGEIVYTTGLQTDLSYDYVESHLSTTSQPPGTYLLTATLIDWTGTEVPYTTDNFVYKCTHEWKECWEIRYQCVAGVDLYIKDGDSDVGNEPDVEITNPIYQSSGIFANNHDSGLANDVDGPLEYDGTNPARVYVHIYNRGCDDYVNMDNDKVHVYWAKASTGLVWDDDWDGTPLSIPPNNPKEGDEISDGMTLGYTIPSIPGGEGSAVVSITDDWIVTNPDHYAPAFNDYNHFCLLARIISAVDAMTNETVDVPWNLGSNATNNNNIAWKNITILNDIPNIVGEEYANDLLVGGSVAHKNNSGKDDYFAFTFIVPEEEGNQIVEEAEVRVMLNDTLWKRWDDGGNIGTNVSISNVDRHQIRIESDTATIKNILVKDGEFELMYVSFNFLTEMVSDKELFEFYVQASLDSTDTIVGGEVYQIEPDINRTLFTASAGSDKEVVIDSIFTVTSKTQAESMITNWYLNGDLIYTGSVLTDTAESAGTGTYVLEQIAESDGYKDYDTMYVNTVLGRIISIAPNPASSGTVAIKYQIEDVSSAVMRIVEVSTSMEVSGSPFSLTVGGIQTLNINVTGYNNGAHSVILEGDSETIDTDLLIKQ